MPCNTAHACHEDIEKTVSISILHIAGAALMATCRSGEPDAVGLLIATGTLSNTIDQSPGDNRVVWITSNDNEQAQWALPATRGINAHHLDGGTRLLQTAAV